MIVFNQEVGTYALLEARPPSKSSKVFLILSIILASVILIGAISFVIVYRLVINKNKSSPIDIENSTELCLTPYCIEAANKLLTNMDETVDPCEDFYEFTCGSWMKNTYIPIDHSETSSFTEVDGHQFDAIVELLSSNEGSHSKSIDNARRLYQSCIDKSTNTQTDIDLINTFINEQFGGYPDAIDSIWNKDQFDLLDKLIKFNQFNTFIFYKVKNVIDYDNLEPLKYRIRITPGYRLGIDDNNDEEHFMKNEQNFAKHLSSALVDSSLSNGYQDILVTNFARELYPYLLSSYSSYSSDDIITTVKNLSQTIGSTFDFSNYLRRLYRLENVSLSDDDIVVVNNIESIREISSIISRQLSSTIQIFMIARFLSSQAFHFPNEIQNLYNNWLQVTLSHVESRELTCARYVNKHMSFAVSKLYIDKYFDRYSMNKSIKLVENLRLASIHLFNQSTWLDGMSKIEMIEKTETMLDKIGYPDYFDDEKFIQLNSMYAEHKFNRSHAANILLLLQLNTKENLRKLRQYINRQEWTDHSPTITNAFYIPIFNEILVPAAFLQPPFFHKNAPEYLNYGVAGSVVGHEISHAFDSDNRMYTKDLKTFTLSSNETIEKFDKRSNCLIEQYSNYVVSQINTRINGISTLSENIADIDGLKKAFYAYQTWKTTHGIIEKKLPRLTKYTAEQLFFISYGQLWCSKMSDTFATYLIQQDSHTPSRFRVQGTTSNLVEFDRTFGCKPGQGNSRVNKCDIW